MIDGVGLSELWSNPMLTLKIVLLLVMTGLLSYVSFGLQPRIDRFLSNVSGQRIPNDVLAKMGPLRLRRKRLAAICLFLLITEVILGVQVFAPLGMVVTIILEAAAALFAWRAYKSVIQFGWI